MSVEALTRPDEEASQEWEPKPELFVSEKRNLDDYGGVFGIAEKNIIPGDKTGYEYEESLKNIFSKQSEGGRIIFKSACNPMAMYVSRENSVEFLNNKAGLDEKNNENLGNLAEEIFRDIITRKNEHYYPKEFVIKLDVREPGGYNFEVIFPDTKEFEKNDLEKGMVILIEDMSSKLEGKSKYLSIYDNGKKKFTSFSFEKNAQK